MSPPAFAPIVKVSSAALVLVVPGVSKDGLKEIVAGAKSKPGELNIANAGEGSLNTSAPSCSRALPASG